MKRKHFLTFIDNSNITRFKQFHKKSINNQINGRDIMLLFYGTEQATFIC